VSVNVDVAPAASTVVDELKRYPVCCIPVSIKAWLSNVSKFGVKNSSRSCSPSLKISSKRRSMPFSHYQWLTSRYLFVHTFFLKNRYRKLRTSYSPTADVQCLQCALHGFVTDNVFRECVPDGGSGLQPERLCCRQWRVWPTARSDDWWRLNGGSVDEERRRRVCQQYHVGIAARYGE